MYQSLGNGIGALLIQVTDKLGAEKDRQVCASGSQFIEFFFCTVIPEQLIFAAAGMLAGTVPLFLLRWRINILTMGDDEARTLGVNAGRLRIIVLCCSTLLTAVSVSLTGMIGWVGLIIPHVSRRIVGNNYKYVIPASIILGAIFLLIVDDISRNLLQTEIPIGILTAVIGAPFFIWLLTRRGDFT